MKLVKLLPGTLITLILMFSTDNIFAVSLYNYNVIDSADIVVAKDGSGNYPTIQQAIDASPNYSAKKTIIFIKNGTYEEALNVGSTKNNLILYGEDNMKTIITYTTATDPDADLATLEVYASDFIANNLTIENTAGPTYGPAQAVRQEVDRSIYLNCRIIANQDTYRSSRNRSYARNCYFEGTVDFIFGPGTFVFEDCTIYSKGGSAITAAKTDEYTDYGYIFRNCRVISKAGTTTRLGRSWGPYADVVYINCELPGEILADGWHYMSHEEYSETARFMEYNNYGPGADTSGRVSWSSRISTDSAAFYSTLDALKYTYSGSPYLDNWNPYEIIDGLGIPGLNNEGDGYGVNEGGNGGTEVTVDNETNLKTYAESEEKYVIKVSGNIALSDTLKVGSNTSITGINETSGISGANISISNNKDNVIIKYLNISNPHGDGITVMNGHKVFLNHLTFSDCGEESCNIGNGSDSVTISWCKFYYTTKQENRLALSANGVIDAETYGNKLNITLHHNWWYENNDQHMPSAVNTKAHIYNNYWNSFDNTNGSYAGHKTEFYSQNNYYDYLNNPCFAEADGLIYSTGNGYKDCTGETSAGTDSVFTPEYNYLLTKNSYVSDIVTSRAGNLWSDPTQYTLKSGSAGNGNVSPNGTRTYNEGYLITLKATPGSGYEFSNWTGDFDTIANPFVFYMKVDYTLTANFTEASAIKESSKESGLTIFPNPSTNGSFYIRQNSTFENLSVEIYNLLGKLVFSETLYQSVSLTQIETNLPKGIYFLSVTNTDGIMNTPIIIKE